MRKLVLGFLLLSTPALATDYYVRTDGNDACNGTANTTGSSGNCAWLSPSKCASATITAGDRCRIQPGTYYVSPGITQVNSGSLKGNDVATCSCTKGSLTISCSADVSGAVAAGDWVRCDASGSYFNWARVASVSTSTINLESAYLGDGGYLGETTGGTHTLDVASMVEVVGDGSPGTIILTRGVAQPGGVTWTQSGTYPEVYSYVKTDAPAGSVWRAPTGMRQTTGTWDKWYKNRDGQDSWVQMYAGATPCALSTCEQQAHAIEGAFCDDGTRVWVRAFRNANPATVGVVASNSVYDQITWTSTRNYFVMRNLVFDTVGHNIGYNTDVTSSFLFGGNDAMIKDVTSIGANCRFDLTSSRTRMEVRGLDCLDKANGATSASAAHSGLRFYDMEVRGGYSNGFRFAELKGASTTDRVMFDRLYVHRVFNYYTGVYPYDCTNGMWPNGNEEAASAHGTDFSDNLAASTNVLRNLIFQNSIVEVTGDGFSAFNDDNSVMYRNCTIGASHSYSNAASTNQEVIRFGVTNSPGNITSYNNVFYVDEQTAGSYYDGAYWSSASNWNSYVGDYNLYLHPWNTTGALNVPLSTETFKGVGSLPDYSLQTMVTSLGQETHSRAVCYGGCTAANALYTNAGASSRNYFVKPYVNDGTASDYTPVLLEPPNVNYLINTGLNAQCPTEDFYGNPRNDGACDIGAVEYQGSHEPAGPHRTDIRAGTILR